MTVISYLKLSKDCGMGCADERQTRMPSGAERSYDIGEKIFRVRETPAFIGRSGESPTTKEMIDLAFSKMQSDSTYPQILEAFRTAYKTIRDDAFQKSMLDRYNTTWKEFHRGHMNPKLRKELKEILESPRHFTASLMLGGYNSEAQEFQAHAIFYPGNTNILETHSSIGTGADSADIVIGNALGSMDPNERANIERYIGARILMEATRAAWRNFGVGGRTQLVWTEGRNFFELDDDVSNLLNNALYCEKKGLLKREYVDGLLAKAIHDKAKAEQLLGDVMSQLATEEMMKIFWVKSLHV